MSRHHRTVVIFQVKMWNSSNLHLFFNRYIEPFSRLIPKDEIGFNLEEFIQGTIGFVLVNHFYGEQEAYERLEEYLDVYFAPEGYGNILTESDRNRLILFTDEMVEVISEDLLKVFEANRLPFDENIDIDSVVVRNGSISFALVDMEKEVW